MDMQFGADGAFYLLTYGDGFFNINPDAGMYKLGVRQGPARPAGRAHHRPHRRPRAADGQVHRARARCDADPGDSIRYRVGLRRRLDDLQRAQPDAHLHADAAATRPS